LKWFSVSLLPGYRFEGQRKGFSLLCQPDPVIFPLAIGDEPDCIIVTLPISSQPDDIVTSVLLANQANPVIVLLHSLDSPLSRVRR
jgi:hypothetical protein